MLGTQYIPLVLKQVVRHPTRSLLTIGGVTVAMFLFATVQAMQAGVQAATQRNAADTALIVYRKDRFCPFTSRLPQSYTEQIARVPGVASVVPVRIVVNNCRTSLDVVTFRGVPPQDFTATYGGELALRAGSLADWERRSDAALLGATLAQRRGLKVGDRFDAAGVTVYVAGIVDAEGPQHQNVAYAHLDFLQFATGTRAGGYVTQFNVKVADPAQLDSVAEQIDALFTSAPEPTYTSAEQAFVAQAASDVIQIVGFTRWLGWGALVAVLALVGNAIILAVQDRIREHAILQTLGFNGQLIARLIVGEGLVVSVIGGLLGSALALVLLSWGSFALSVDGHSIVLQVGPRTIVTGLLLSGLLGIGAGLVPAIQAARREVVTCFRAV